MTTLTLLVESIIKQLKPNLTDDVEISETWIKEVIHQSRAALINKKFIAGELFNNYYQEMEVDTVDYSSKTISGLIVPFAIPFQVATIPTLLLKAGKRTVDYLGSIDMSKTNIDYIEFNEFIAYDMHRFGSKETCYTLRTDVLMIRNANGQTKWLLRALFAVPTDVPNYDEDNSIYPIDASDIRSLEIITFQHIAPKLGLPVDLFNNSQDETKNAPVTQQIKQSQQQPEE